MTATRGTRRLLDGDSFRAACSRESELTPRQLEVLKLLASGKTNWEIAEHFGITLDGAKWHVGEILGKLGFASREEASAYWHWRRRPRQRLNRAMLALTALSLRRLLQVGAAVAAGAALAIAALVVAAVSRDGDPSLNRLLPGSAGEDPSPAAEATPSAEGPTARTDLYTEIYDRGGPDGGTLLGVLANPYAGRTAPPIRAAAFIDNLVEPRLIRMCEAGLLPPRANDPDCTWSIHTSGYTVTTSLDLELTEQAMGMIDEFVRSGLEEGCECHNGAIVTIDPASGQVVVYAPNRDPAESSNRRIAGDIDQLIEVNQAGPVFAPIVYLAWFERLGKAPLSTLWDTSPLDIDGIVQVSNPRPMPGTEGLISARAALAGSQHVPAFRAAYEAGVDGVIEIAKRLGITTIDQGFDPTWRSHPDVTYGPSIATGGANVRALDIAYMNATIANMGTMVGVPHLADTLEPESLESFAIATGPDYEEAIRQFWSFVSGDARLPGTRALDPVVILEVRDADGRVIFRQGQPERRQVVNAGSVWLLHSILSDCTARFIIWACGRSNSDLGLDFYLGDGRRVPGGVQTEIAPFPPDDVLEAWMAGYTRYAATAVWVGNADNRPIMDGPAWNYASSRTVTTLWKRWMGAYHDHLQAKRVFDIPLGFEDLQPANVRFGPFRSVATDRILEPEQGSDYAGLCAQTVDGWMRTDIEYQDECEEVEVDLRDEQPATAQTPDEFRETRRVVKLPTLRPDLAVSLAVDMGIPVLPAEANPAAAR